jgi:outer membrane murein-binding lipoprotein Lpp
MTKKMILLIVVMCICAALAGCAPDEELETYIDALEQRATEVRAEISELEAERDALAKEVTERKVENGTAKYMVTFKIKQRHYNLSIAEAIKDNANAITIQIPVDKEFYESVDVGEIISDEFRYGSLFLSGSFGRWDITVDSKNIQ